MMGHYDFTFKHTKNTDPEFPPQISWKCEQILA
jgi:hypothetical protein